MMQLNVDILHCKSWYLWERNRFIGKLPRTCICLRHGFFSEITSREIQEKTAPICSETCSLNLGKYSSRSTCPRRPSSAVIVPVSSADSTAKKVNFPLQKAGKQRSCFISLNTKVLGRSDLLYEKTFNNRFSPARILTQFAKLV